MKQCPSKRSRDYDLKPVHITSYINFHQYGKFQVSQKKTHFDVYSRKNPFWMR